MDGGFDRVSRWWKQGNAMAVLTGEHGLDEVRDAEASEAEPGQRVPGLSGAAPIEEPRARWQHLVRGLAVLTVLVIILTLVSIVSRTW
jgi:hypothetical protein